MAEEKKTKAAPKKAAAKTTTAKAAPKKAAEKKPAAKKAAAKTITVRQIGSPISRTKDQRATLVGLRLNKMHRTSTLEDTPSVRGMINKVSHLVEIVNDAA